MSDKNLRSALIRLAHTKPELRAELLPLLGKKASGPSVKDAVVTGSLTTKGVQVKVSLYSEVLFKTPGPDWGLPIESLTPKLGAAGAEQISQAEAFMGAVVKASQKAPEVWGIPCKSFARSDNGYGSDPMAQMNSVGLSVSSKPTFHLIAVPAALKDPDISKKLEMFNTGLLRLAELWF